MFSMKDLFVYFLKLKH